MSDAAQGPGWWQASDGRWYPPEALAQAMGQAAAQPQPAGVAAQPLATTGAAAQAAAGAGVAQPQPAQPPALPGYGQPPGPEMAGYLWPGYATYPSWRRNRGVGALLVLLGVGGVAWGVGELFAALALNGSPVYPRDEQIGAWIITGGILLASLTTIVIGLVHRRP